MASRKQVHRLQEGCTGNGQFNSVIPLLDKVTQRALQRVSGVESAIFGFLSPNDGAPDKIRQRDEEAVDP